MRLRQHVSIFKRNKVSLSAWRLCFAELVYKFVQMIRQSNMSDAEKQQIIADLRAFKISLLKQRLNKL